MKRRFTYLLTALALLAFLSPTTAWGGVKLADTQRITQKTAHETMLGVPEEGMTRDVTTLFQETFGESTNNVDYTSYEGYSAQTSMFYNNGNASVASHFSGTGKVGKKTVDASSGYNGVSGNSAAWFTASTGNNTNNALVISGINISGYTDLALSFGMLKKNGTNLTNVTSVSYSIDGGTTQTFSFTHPTDANWQLISGNLAGEGNSLTITFTMTTTGGFTTRYDDIVVTGTLAGPTSPTEPTPAN